MTRCITWLSTVLLTCCVFKLTTAGAVSKTGRIAAINQYSLYTRDDPREAIPLYATAASATAARTMRAKTVFLILDHGTGSSTTFGTVVKDALLTAEDVNVVVINNPSMMWAPAAQVALYAPEIGFGISELIRFFVNARRITLANLHVVGFGVGAHIAGLAGRLVTTGKIGRITALDPLGGTLWATNINRLTHTDADYVEVIHTEINTIGLADAIGHVDFYPNSGTNSPGCTPTDNDCNHNFSWQLFAASLTHRNKLIGHLCNENSSPTEPNCRGFMLELGNDDLQKIGSGRFYLATTDLYPYAVEESCPADTVL